MKSVTERGRYLKLDEFAAYTSLGRSSARLAGKVTGAERRIGRRCVYDTKAFDDYVATHGAVELPKQEQSIAEQLASGLKS